MVTAFAVRGKSAIQQYIDRLMQLFRDLFLKAVVIPVGDIDSTTFILHCTLFSSNVFKP